MTDNAIDPITKKPTKLIVGYKDDVSTAAERITYKPTKIYDCVTITCRSLGTGVFIALGTEDEQPFRLTGVNQSIDITFIDDLSKIVVVTDAGNTGYLQWIGG